MLKIYNTLTNQKEEFKPLVEKQVKLYVCGVTVYDDCHIGHARTYTSFDIVLRYLRLRGYQVTYVRNITDIDDKIIKKANQNNEKVAEVTERYIKAMVEDFNRLGLISPDHEPKATEKLPEMLALIEKMIANQHAYVASNGDVYFSVRKIKDYGCLSHHDIDQLESGARVEVNDVKNDPLDFVLWKLAKTGEPSWDSPWGPGRPGWHTECVAMAMQLLGEQFDIHGGGRDLIFPHHENEIAQAHAVGSSFSKLWMHGGFLQIDKEKMSKSLNNFITIGEVLNDYPAEVVRYFLTASHYRSPLSYSSDLLVQAKQSLTRLYTALRFLPASERIQNTRFENDFYAAMDDDFNTPLALSVLFDLAHEVERLRDKDQIQAAAHSALLRYLGNALGLLTNDADQFFQGESHEVDASKIENLIALRQAARQEKNWAEADRLRKALAEMSIIIEDSPQGTTWKKV